MGSRPSSAQLLLRRLSYSTRGDIFFIYRVLIGEGLLARRFVWNWQTSVVGALAANLFLRDYLRGCATLLRSRRGVWCSAATLLRSLPTRVPSMTRLGLPGSFRLPLALVPARHLFRASSARGTV